MKSIMSILLLLSFVSLNAVAGGSIIGSGRIGGVDAFTMMKPSIVSPVDLSGGVKQPDQVYYMRQKQAEIQFATNTPGDNKVEIQSLRPEEISNPAVMEGLKRSQQTRKWESVKALNQDKIESIMKMLDESK